VTENLLRATLTALAEAEVDFVVCGGVACILQGVARATHDLDLRIDLDDANLARLVEVARGLGLTPRIPEPLEALLDPERRRVWTDEKRAIVYTLISPTGAFSVDVFLRYPLTFSDLTADADVFEIDHHQIRVSSKAHLLEAKRAVHPPRKKDLRDIEDLMELLDG